MRIREDTCETLERAVQDAENELRDRQTQARDVDSRSEKFIKRSNEASAQLAKQWGLMGGRSIIENIPKKLIRGGILFLERLNLIDTPKEQTAEVIRTKNRAAALFRDERVADEEKRKVSEALERAKANLELKKRVLEECRKRIKSF